MAGKKTVTQRRSIYNRRRYWYHVSTTLKRNELRLIPWDIDDDGSFNRSGNEPEGARICVAPTIEQCIVAIPYDPFSTITIYRTKSPIKASRPHGVFDAKVTEEGWLQKPTTFIKIGTLDFEKLAKKQKDEFVPRSAATTDSIREQRKVLKWWKNAKIKDTIKST